MKKSLPLVLAALLAFAVPAPAGQKPDFSGTWVIVNPPEHAGQAETIVHSGDTMTLTHGASHGGEHGTTYKLDGTGSRSVLMSHGEEIVTMAMASWEGEQLVILQRTQHPNGTKVESRLTFALNASGELVRELVDIVDGKAQPPITTVARRK